MKYIKDKCKGAQAGQEGPDGDPRESQHGGKVEAQLARPAPTSWQKDRKARGEFGPRRSHDLIYILLMEVVWK